MKLDTQVNWLNQFHIILQEIIADITDNDDDHKRILNAFFTMPSLGKETDSPPVDELQLFNINSVPYLINTDCACNILVAVLKEYNNETPDQYFKRIISNIMTNQKFDSSKVLVAWCFGHSIRAIHHHIRSKKFIIEASNNREILAKFAMRVWNAVRSYFEKVWWKTIVLWSNLVPAIRDRTRRTTATVEVENNIVKNLDIDYRKTLDTPSQYRIAREIREISTHEIGFNQSMVSRLYNNVGIPKCDEILSAIKCWINKELERKEKKKEF
ncbi:hypothetical protein C1646_748489 [Rhizophagus diaphanus]|nr:hypothetical protein C1646_748489 [Rhizophagus diaphanus] [Rhizophagus sp. MUCL 43196]